jgi:hypothetical protein
MRVYSTSDIPLEDLHKLSDDLGPDFELQVDESQMFYKGGVPPSWVVFFATPDWLIKALELYAGLYVAEIVKEAGKDTWKNRKKITSAAGDRIRQFAVALGKLRTRLSLGTRVQIGLPLPDDHDGTRLELVGTDVDDLAFQIAVFVHHLPALMSLIKQENLGRGRVAAGIHLQILADASLEVWWQDNTSLEKQVRLLPLRSVASLEHE